MTHLGTIFHVTETEIILSFCSYPSGTASSVPSSGKTISIPHMPRIPMIKALPPPHQPSMSSIHSGTFNRASFKKWTYLTTLEIQFR